MPPICREDLVYDNPSYRGLGPTDYFGRTMVENTPDNVRIGVICVAVGAAKIEGFYRDINTAQDYYNHQCKDYVREKFAMYDYYGYGTQEEAEQLVVAPDAVAEDDAIYVDSSVVSDFEDNVLGTHAQEIESAPVEEEKVYDDTDMEKINKLLDEINS